MKHKVAVFIAACLLLFSCSKGLSPAHALTGTWVLTRQCVCNGCSESVSGNGAQTLNFSSDGKVQLTAGTGDSVKSLNGTYLITKQSENDRILNIDLAGPDSFKHFLYIPGSQIVSVSAGKLVLNLSTPFFNPCLFQNTYNRVSP